MLHGSPLVIPDIYADPRVLHEVYRDTFVQSMAMVPVGQPPIAAIGAYWKNPHTATDDELAVLVAIAESAALALTPP